MRNDFSQILIRFADRHKDIALAETRTGLAYGNSGSTLLYYGLYKLTGDKKYLDLVFTLLNSAISTLEVNRFNILPNLGEGVLGLLHTLQYLQRDAVLTLDDFSQVFEELSPFMTLAFRAYQETSNLDLFTGMNGLMVTLLEAGKIQEVDFSAYRGLVNNIKESPAVQDSMYNLGLPHGILGHILVLLKVQHSVARKHANDLLIRDLFRLARRNIVQMDGRHSLPAKVDPITGRIHPSALSWCYGDLIAAYLLTEYAFLIGNKKLQHICENMCSALLHRRDLIEENLTLCHGMPVIALLWHKIAKRIPNPAFLEAFRYWNNLALDQITEWCYRYEKTGENEQFFQDCSLMYGAAGALVCLMTLNHDMPGHWDKYIFL